VSGGAAWSRAAVVWWIRGIIEENGATGRALHATGY
jgi:hypothetical protein